MSDEIRRSPVETDQGLAAARARQARAHHVGFRIPDVDFLLDYIDALTAKVTSREVDIRELGDDINDLVDELNAARADRDEWRTLAEDRTRALIAIEAERDALRAAMRFVVCEMDNTIMAYEDENRWHDVLRSALDHSPSSEEAGT